MGKFLERPTPHPKFEYVRKRYSLSSLFSPEMLEQLDHRQSTRRLDHLDALLLS